MVYNKMSQVIYIFFSQHSKSHTFSFFPQYEGLFCGTSCIFRWSHLWTPVNSLINFIFTVGISTSTIVVIFYAVYRTDYIYSTDHYVFSNTRYRFFFFFCIANLYIFFVFSFGIHITHSSAFINFSGGNGEKKQFCHQVLGS